MPFLSCASPFFAPHPRLPIPQTSPADLLPSFPNDHTHTSPEDADLVAQAFAQAIATSMNGTTSLVDYIVSDYAKVY